MEHPSWVLNPHLQIPSPLRHQSPHWDPKEGPEPS